MIKPMPISGFGENLPEEQLLEDTYKEIIRKNYSLSGFTPLDTPVVERLEVLLAKGADDNEVYAISRVNGEEGDDSSLGLRFDLTVPLARYISQYEGEITFPFRRQHIARVYRGERPQKGRYREFYQADVDIIGNGTLPLFADSEVIFTIYNSLKNLDFGDFVININNKKFLIGFLETINIENISQAISIIDKKDKVRNDKLKEMFISIGLNELQIEKIVEFIKFSEIKNNKEILTFYEQYDNEMLKTGLSELKNVYENLLYLGVDEKYLKINPSISRGLNYYTGIVFETFISGAENMGSISSGGRYENLASNFTKNNFPGVGGSIGLSRLISVLKNLGKIELNRKTISEALVLNLGPETFTYNLSILKKLREKNINTEIYLDSETKIQKQLKYANNKKIKFAIICGTREVENNVVLLKNLDSGEQYESSLDEIIKKIKLYYIK